MASLNVGMAGRLPAERSFGAKTFRVAGLSGPSVLPGIQGPWSFDGLTYSRAQLRPSWAFLF